MGHGQALVDSDEDDEVIADLRPLGSMRDSLQTATAHCQTLEKLVCIALLSVDYFLKVMLYRYEKLK